MPECRTIVDAAHSGAWNMALDEVLLARAAADKQLQLRFYAWQPATLSLGYFQQVADRQTHPPSNSLPFVRRPSGGGAIVHDREITYCLALPGDRLNGTAVYRRVHGALVEMFGDLGVKAELVEAVPQGKPAAFLCFQRRAVGDVLIAGHKVIGSAQRRRRGALLQHGSILLGASPAAPELPGLAELTTLTLTREEWLPRLSNSLSRALDCSLDEVPPTELEMEQARQVVESKYATAWWNRSK